SPQYRPAAPLQRSGRSLSYGCDRQNERRFRAASATGAERQLRLPGAQAGEQTGAAAACVTTIPAPLRNLTSFDKSRLERRHKTSPAAPPIHQAGIRECHSSSTNQTIYG